RGRRARTFCQAAPSTIFRLPSGDFSFTVVVFSMAIMMQETFLALADGPSYRVIVTRFFVSFTFTRSSTVHGSTPDHQVSRTLRPSSTGVAFVKRTLRGLTASPVGLTGRGFADGGVVIAESATGELDTGVSGPGVAACWAGRSAPHPAAKTRHPATRVAVTVRIPLRRIRPATGSVGHERLWRRAVRGSGHE